MCACTVMLWMCVLYVSFGSKVRPKTFACVAMDSAVLCILSSRLLAYSAESGVNTVQVILSGFSMRLFVLSRQKLYVGKFVLYLLTACVLMCVDVMVMSSA